MQGEFCLGKTLTDYIELIAAPKLYGFRGPTRHAIVIGDYQQTHGTLQPCPQVGRVDRPDEALVLVRCQLHLHHDTKHRSLVLQDHDEIADGAD